VRELGRPCCAGRGRGRQRGRAELQRDRATIHFISISTDPAPIRPAQHYISRPRRAFRGGQRPPAGQLHSGRTGAASATARHPAGPPRPRRAPRSSGAHPAPAARRPRQQEQALPAPPAPRHGARPRRRRAAAERHARRQRLGGVAREPLARAAAGRAAGPDHRRARPASAGARRAWRPPAGRRVRDGLRRAARTERRTRPGHGFEPHLERAACFFGRRRDGPGSSRPRRGDRRRGRARCYRPREVSAGGVRRGQAACGGRRADAERAGAVGSDAPARLQLPDCRRPWPSLAAPCACNGHRSP
jgi:hypothetical protein